LLVPQHVEHRATGGAARLAVVVGRRVPTRHERPAHVTRVRMLLPQLGHARERLLAARNGLDASEEATLLDDELAVVRLGEGEGHGSASRSSCRAMTSPVHAVRLSSARCQCGALATAVAM